MLGGLCIASLCCSCRAQRGHSQYPFVANGDHDLLLLAKSDKVHRENERLFERFKHAVLSKAFVNDAGVAVQGAQPTRESSPGFDLRFRGVASGDDVPKMLFHGQSQGATEIRQLFGVSRDKAFSHTAIDHDFYLSAIPAGDAIYAVYLLPRKGKSIKSLLARLQWKELERALRRTETLPCASSL